MASLPCPGPSPISLLDIQNTFGGFYPTGIAEYYRDAGILSPTDEGTIGVPYTGSPISFADFFCKYPIYVLTVNTLYTGTYDICFQFTNAFGNDAWTGPAKKILNITSTGIIRANSIGASSALYLYDRISGLTGPQLGGSLRINNAGIIYGMGGNQPNSDGGGQGSYKNGGTAFQIYSSKIPITLNNTGQIKGGGGGGGRGGYGNTYGTFGQSKIYASNVGGMGGYGRGSLFMDATGVSGTPPFTDVRINPAAPGIVAPVPAPDYTCYVDANTSILTDNFWMVGFTARFYVAAKNPSYSHTLQLDGSTSGGGVAIDTYYLYLSSNSNNVYISLNQNTKILNLYIYAAPNSGTVTVSAFLNVINIYGSRSSTSGAIAVTGSPTSVSNNLTISESNPSYNISNFSATGSLGNLDVPSALSQAGYGGNGGDYGQPGSAGTNGTVSNGQAGGTAGYSITGTSYINNQTSTLGTLVGPTSP